MDIKQFDAANAYGTAKNALGGASLGGSLGNNGLSGGENVAGGGNAFTQLVEDTINNVRQTSNVAETASAKALTGEADLVDVVTAVTNAELAVETVVAIRDKVITAYEEIVKMPL